MKENIKFFNTLEEADGYVIKDVPFTGYIRERKQTLYNIKPKTIIVVNGEGEVIIDELINQADLTLYSQGIYAQCVSSHIDCEFNYPGFEIISVIGDSHCTISNLYQNQFDIEFDEGDYSNVNLSITFVDENNNSKTLDKQLPVEDISIIYGSSQKLPNISGTVHYYNAGVGIIKSINGQNFSIPGYYIQDNKSITSLNILKNVTSIGGVAFNQCTNLSNVVLGNSVTSIGESAFFYCTGLTSVTIGNSVTSIENYAFAYCTGLTSITIPNSVTRIGNNAFYKCIGLTSVTIGNGVTYIGGIAFNDCSGLTSISYTGTISQYNSISKASNWHYNVPATQVYCLGENPPKYTPI